MKARFSTPEDRFIRIADPDLNIPLLWNEVLRFGNSSVNRVDYVRATELPKIIQKLVEVLDRLIDEAKPYHSSDRIHKIINGKSVFFNKALTEHVVIMRYNSFLEMFSEAALKKQDIKVELLE